MENLQMDQKERFTEMAKRIQDAGNKLVMVINNDEEPGIVEVKEYNMIDDDGILVPYLLIESDTFIIKNEEAEEILWEVGYVYPEIRDMEEITYEERLQMIEEMEEEQGFEFSHEEFQQLL